MSRVSRRSFLSHTGGGVLAAGVGGAVTILSPYGWPAYAQRSAVHWLRSMDFVPASDDLLRRELVPAAQKALGVSVGFETVNANDLQPRSMAAVQSGSGPDIVMMLNSWPHMYSEVAVDISDVAEEVASKQGGFYPLCTGYTREGKKQLAMPFCIIPTLIAYRKSWFEEVGVTKFPETWDEYREVGKKLKANGRPIGQALGHSLVAGPAFLYPFLWSWGGREVDVDGKTVVINSKETIESVKFMIALWKDVLDEGSLSWNDSSNDNAFLSQAISATLSGVSIYVETLRKPDRYRTEKGAPLNTDILYAPLPKGPAGQFAFHTLQSHMVPRYSKNQQAAKELLKWLHTAANYERWFDVQRGLVSGVTMDWEKSKIWEQDPVIAPYRVAARLGRAPGYPGPGSANAAAVVSRYIITDMYAKAVQGMAAEDAVKWAEAELKKVYR